MKNCKKELIVLVLTTFLCVQTSYAQDDAHLSSKKGESTLGIGLGLPYGGIGVRFGTNVTDGLNLFGGLGYQLAGVGYNFGLMKDFPSNSSTQFYLTGMYGTNAAIKVQGLSEYDKVYSGATFGLGIKINSRMSEGNYWDIGLLAPIRSSSFKDDENKLENDSRVEDITSPWPILIVVGYNFNL